MHKFNDTEINDILEFTEKEIPKYLKDHNICIDDIYSNMNISFWNNINIKPDLKNIAQNKQYYGSLMKSLKYIKGFIEFFKKEEYKKQLENKIKEEKKEKKKQSSTLDLPPIDTSIPEGEDEIRPEGTVTQVCVTKYERNPKYRAIALKEYGYKCQVCGIDFEKVYGEIGKNFIEIHHLYPVSQMGDNYKFNPLDKEKGLIPLCSNCHSMIHRGGKKVVINDRITTIPMSLDELKELFKTRNK